MTTTRTMLSVKEVAERLDIRRRDVFRMIDHGELPGFKGERGLVVVPEDAVSALEVPRIEPSTGQAVEDLGAREVTEQ